MEWALLGIVLALGILSIPILWVLVLTRRGEDAALRGRIAALEQRVAWLQARLERDAAAPAQPSPSPAPPVSAPQASAPPPSAPAPPPPPPEPSPVTQPSPPTVAPAAARESWEAWIMRRWAVWLGALALALGGVFLVKYSIEQGFFGPTARVALGLLLGLALLGLSEAARRQPLAALPLGALAPDNVPPALAAAGIAVLFASLYAGYALYDLIPPGPAFLLLAAVALGGAALSLRHGMLLAVLGLAGAYIVPALISTNAPSPPRLLAYVLVVSAGCLWLVRWRDWPWLGWIAIAGSGLWCLAALSFAARGDEAWVGIYLLLLAPLFVAAWSEEAGARHRALVSWSGASLAAFLMLVLVLWAEVDAASLAFAWTLTALYAAPGVRWARFDRLPWLAALLQLLVLAGWVFADGAGGDRLERLLTLPAGGVGPYLAMATMVAALAGFGGFVLLPRAARPDRWALLSAATPLAALAIVYWRVEQLEASLPWAAAAFLLAALYLAAVERLAPRRATPGFTSALACYALATTGAVALALTLSLRLGWLSVALSLQLPAIAWLHQRTGVRALRLAALVIGIVVLVRLLLNPAVADYALGSWPVFNALLYTYGIPTAAFAIASRWLGRDRDDAATQLLEAGALALGVALASLEIRHFVGGGRIDSEAYGLFEQALQTGAWLAIAYGLMPRAGATERPVRAAAWRILLGMAALNFVVFTCLVSNPLLAAEPVGALPLFDTLLLAYALPAGFAVLYHRAFRRLGMAEAARWSGIAALAIAFLYLSLEVRHLFHGSRLDIGGVSDGEWYAYSVAWLIYGAALLAAGILRREAWLRFAGLVVAALVAVKAFGFDMAALTGLYRAASFLGLGASLLAIGWLYQRVTAPGAAEGGG